MRIIFFVLCLLLILSACTTNLTEFKFLFQKKTGIDIELNIEDIKVKNHNVGTMLSDSYKDFDVKIDSVSMATLESKIMSNSKLYFNTFDNRISHGTPGSWFISKDTLIWLQMGKENNCPEQVIVIPKTRQILFNTSCE